MLRQMCHLQCILNSGLLFFLRQIHELQGIGHILFYRHPGEQGIVLEYITTFRGRTVNRHSIQQNRTFGAVLEAAHHRQKGGLAAAGGTQQRDKFTIADFKIHIIQNHLGLTGAVCEDLAYMINL